MNRTKIISARRKKWNSKLTRKKMEIEVDKKKKMTKRKKYRSLSLSFQPALHMESIEEEKFLHKCRNVFLLGVNKYASLSRTVRSVLPWFKLSIKSYTTAHFRNCFLKLAFVFLSSKLLSKRVWLLLYIWHIVTLFPRSGIQMKISCIVLNSTNNDKCLRKKEIWTDQTANYWELLLKGRGVLLNWWYFNWFRTLSYADFFISSSGSSMFTLGASTLLLWCYVSLFGHLHLKHWTNPYFYELPILASVFENQPILEWVWSFFGHQQYQPWTQSGPAVISFPLFLHE